MRKTRLKATVLAFTLIIGQLLWLPASFAADITVYIHGEYKQFDPAPFIQNGRTLVPLRAFAESLGASVGWEPETTTVTIQRGDNTAVLRIDDSVASVNGQAVRLDVPPAIYQDRTFVPLRFVGEALGEQVAWDGDTYTISVGQAPERSDQSGNKRGNIQIVGSPVFIEKINAALDIIQRTPEFYVGVQNYLTRITEGEHSGVMVETGNFTIGDTVNADPVWLAGTIVHDAYHVQLFRQGMVYDGWQGEKAAINRQEAFLRALGGQEHYIQYLDGVLNSQYWEVPYEQRNW